MAKSVRGVYSGTADELVVLVAEDGDIRLTVVDADKNLSLFLPAKAARRLGERLIQAAGASEEGEAVE